MSAQAESCCNCVKPRTIMQHIHGGIPCMFDCWPDPVVHLLLLKSSTVKRTAEKCRDVKVLKFQMLLVVVLKSLLVVA